MDDITKDAIASGDRGAINGLVGQVSHGLQLQSLRRIPTAAVRLTCVSLQLQPPWRIRTAAASCKVTDPGGLSVAEANDTIDAMSVLAAALPASALTSLDLSANELPIVAVQVR